MRTITKTRVIRPSTRQAKSKSYKVDTSRVGIDDILVVEISHESKPFCYKAFFPGSEVVGRGSIHFSVEEDCKITWIGVQPRPIPLPTQIQLQPHWFENGYYVYLVSIVYQTKRYFYVGMTGDRKYITARSPFYRMIGHFALGNSTQNQIIKGIRRHFPDREINDVLRNAEFTYYAWKLRDFHALIEQDEHRSNRNQAESVESYLIQHIIEKYPAAILFNTRKSTRRIESGKMIGELILQDLAKQLEC